MHIQCPSCDATFSLPDGALAGGARKVRCSKCSFIWTVGAAAKPAVQEVAAKAPPKAAPAPQGKAVWKGFDLQELAGLAAAVGLTLLAIGLAGFWAFTGTGSAMLALSKLQLVPEKNMGGERFEQVETFMVNGSVTNQSTTPMPMPSVRIHAMTADGSVAYVRHLKGGAQMIPGASTVDFSIARLPRTDSSITRFAVDIGTGRELLLRPVPYATH